MIRIGIASDADFERWKELQRVNMAGQAAYQDRIEWAEYCRLKAKWEGKGPT